MDFQHLKNKWPNGGYKQSLKLSDEVIQEAVQDIDHLIQYAEYCERVVNEMDRDRRKVQGASSVGVK